MHSAGSPPMRPNSSSTSLTICVAQVFMAQVCEALQATTTVLTLGKLPVLFSA